MCYFLNLIFFKVCLQKGTVSKKSDQIISSYKVIVQLEPTSLQILNMFPKNIILKEIPTLQHKYLTVSERLIDAFLPNMLCRERNFIF
jgi:hypothetical protein